MAKSVRQQLSTNGIGGNNNFLNLLRSSQRPGATAKSISFRTIIFAITGLAVDLV